MTDDGMAFDAAQPLRWRAVFPAGVCDGSKPGAEQHSLRATRLRC